LIQCGGRVLLYAFPGKLRHHIPFALELRRFSVEVGGIGQSPQYLVIGREYL
jgi:hypothetical protein